MIGALPPSQGWRLLFLQTAYHHTQSADGTVPQLQFEQMTARYALPPYAPKLTTTWYQQICRYAHPHSHLQPRSPVDAQRLLFLRQHTPRKTVLNSLPLRSASLTQRPRRLLLEAPAPAPPAPHPLSQPPEFRPALTPEPTHKRKTKISCAPYFFSPVAVLPSRNRGSQTLHLIPASQAPCSLAPSSRPTRHRGTEQDSTSRISHITAANLPRLFPGAALVFIPLPYSPLPPPTRK